MVFRKNKVVLALGGGGSRGLAHLGVVRVLEREEIPIAGIVGTSVGSILGASYGLEPDSEALIASTLDQRSKQRLPGPHEGRRFDLRVLQSRCIIAINDAERHTRSQGVGRSAVDRDNIPLLHHVTDLTLSRFELVAPQPV